MDTADVVRRGREAFDRQAWGDAYRQLSAADREAPLGVPDLEHLALVAQLVGEVAASTDLWARAHHAYLDAGDPVRAARCAFWLAMELMNAGEAAAAGGWLARAGRLVEEHGGDCVEAGLLLLPVGLGQVGAGAADDALATFTRAGAIGARFGDPDLATLARLGSGRALILLDRPGEGMAALDEAMIAVTAGEVSPVVTGIVYCAVISACHAVFDLQRAQEWTVALGRWCEEHPDLVPFRGQCLIHRAQVLQVHGAWTAAFDEVARACEQLARPPASPAIGVAHYVRGELHRTRGELDAADAAYREASRWGHVPQPGLALLRLAQGRVDAAVAAIRLAVHEAQDRVARPGALAAAVEIHLAAGDVAGARAAADELTALVASIGSRYLRATADHAAGAVDLAGGDAHTALAALRRAATAWRELDAPHEAARTGVLVGLACRALGDGDAAAVELDEARRAFERLGAASDLAALVRAGAADPAPVGPPAAGDAAPAPPAGNLTAREVEVLRLLATGCTNREIAAALVISEHTVRRHLQNVFAKLGVSTRAAASAYAVRHGMA